MYFSYISQCIKKMYSPISFRVTSLALGQSYVYPSGSDTTLKNIGRMNHMIPNDMILQPQQNIPSSL